MDELSQYRSVRFDEDQNELIIIDQTLLPNQVSFSNLNNIEAIWEAIQMLRVRGAPAIGVAAAYGVYLAVADSQTDSSSRFRDEFMKAKAYLATSRPTAVNLFWALDRMERRLAADSGKPVDEAKRNLLAEAKAIQAEDVAMCRAIGENGLPLLEPGMGVLTHCNTGQLAASQYGTALAPIYMAHEKGYGLRVFADETRPLLQGARLTAFELMKAGVDVTLICDSAAASVMKKGWVRIVMLGCDRIARNGDTANKIGTLSVAILAKRFGIPFYVIGPTSTIDMDCPNGAAIDIEERAPEEVTSLWYEKPMAPEGVKVFNPAFDVTDNDLVSGIITEKGIARPPFEQSFKSWFGTEG